MRNSGYEYVFDFKFIVNNTQYQNNQQYSLLFEKKSRMYGEYSCKLS